MSAADYRCSCGEPATAVYCMRDTGAIYGNCDKHLMPLVDGDTWVWPPTEEQLARLEVTKRQLRREWLGDRIASINLSIADHQSMIDEWTAKNRAYQNELDQLNKTLP